MYEILTCTHVMTKDRGAIPVHMISGCPCCGGKEGRVAICENCDELRDEWAKEVRRAGGTPSVSVIPGIGTDWLRVTEEVLEARMPGILAEFPVPDAAQKPN
jgi:hypothetical protein